MLLTGLWQMCLARIRAISRDPATLAWALAFPLFSSLVLGAAFRGVAEGPAVVALASGPGEANYATGLASEPGLVVIRTDLPTAMRMLRRAEVAAIVALDDGPRILSDPTRPESRAARLLTIDTLERQSGRVDQLHVRDEPMTQSDVRYIDFLIPGLLGLGLMTSGLWSVGLQLAQMRVMNLLKRLRGTPMGLATLFASFLLVRVGLSLLEISFFVGFSRAAFNVTLRGGLLSLFLFAVLGGATFASMSLMLASRVRTSEGAAGITNLVLFPMTMVSGVFFPASRFPSWASTFINALPLTALNDGLRAIMNEGKPLSALGTQCAVLLVWGIASFVAALLLFRWK